MKIQLDLKSLALGLLLGITAMLALGAVRQPPPPAAESPDYDLEFASPTKAYLLNRHTAEYQRLDVTGPEGTLQRVGNPEKPR